MRNERYFRTANVNFCNTDFGCIAYYLAVERIYKEMNDRFRYRVWDKTQNKWLHFDFSTYPTYQDRIWQALTDGETFYQCTGLKDKNGKLIYEGDILKIKSCDNSFIVQCVFEMNYGYGINSPSFVLVGVDGCNHHYSFSCDEKIIIGNIYENPELLKECE